MKCFPEITNAFFFCVCVYLMHGILMRWSFGLKEMETPIAVYKRIAINTNGILFESILDYYLTFVYSMIYVFGQAAYLWNQLCFSVGSDIIELRGVLSK